VEARSGSRFSSFSYEFDIHFGASILFDLKIKISRIWALIRLSVADINKNNSVRQSEFKNFIIRQ
jgi:hypothetical protein